MILFSNPTSPGNLVPAASGFWGLRSYNASYATGSNNAIKVRRASDNTAQDIVILSNGNLDIGSANTFAGVDCTATGSTSGSSTTIALTGASSTPTAGDTVTGAGIVQPCYVASVGSFTGGAGNVVVNQAQTLSSVSLSFQVALFVTEVYDQSGNGAHMVQATNANQAQLLPNCVNGLPAMLFTTALSQIYLGTLPGTVVQPWSVSAVVQRSGNTGNFTEYLGGHNTTAAGWEDTTNTAYAASEATANVTSTASDNAPHSIQSILNGGSSFVVVDGTAGSLQIGGNFPFPTDVALGNEAFGSFPFMTGLIMTVGLWPVGFTPTQYAALHASDSKYWATP